MQQQFSVRDTAKSDLKNDLHHQNKTSEEPNAWQVVENAEVDEAHKDHVETVDETFLGSVNCPNREEFDNKLVGKMQS